MPRCRNVTDVPRHHTPLQSDETALLRQTVRLARCIALERASQFRSETPAQHEGLPILRSSVYSAHMAKEMRDPTFVILSALVSEPRHGYAIITDALALSDGAVRLQPGTLYAALDRLRTEGLVGVEREEVVQGRLRRYFALTDAGIGALSEEAARRQAMTSRLLERLRTPGRVLPS